MREQAIKYETNGNFCSPVLPLLCLYYLHKRCASLICYQCDDIWVTTTNLKLPTNCVRMNVNKTYCAMTIVFNNNINGYVQITSENGHQAYHYDEDFVLLGLTMRSDGSFTYGLTYHCLADGCNEPSLKKIQLLFDSTTIEHNIKTILRLLYIRTPERPLPCSKYTNCTDPNTCYQPKEINVVCSRCFTTINGITNAICAHCLENVKPIFDILDDERAYLLKAKTTKNHHYEVYCNMPECNRLDKIQQIQKLHRYDFDYDRFMGKSISSLLLSNKNIIYFHLFILCIWNIL
ncbi:unnamed protein product [Rotaria socialis]